MAPAEYYKSKGPDLAVLEQALNLELEAFTTGRQMKLDLSFRLMAFQADFDYRPGMDPERLRAAVANRVSAIVRGIEVTGYGGAQVLSFEDRESFGMPPRRKAKQWKAGRSACELARSWTPSGLPQVPNDLKETFNSNPLTLGLIVESGTIEHETVLPFGPRGPRCHDLLLHARSGERKVMISIEGKADEPFGGTVFKELRRARLRPKTNFPRRLQWLTHSLLGVDAFADVAMTTLTEAISGLPYQLLSGIAGLIIEAQQHQCMDAVLIIHEFRTSETTDKKLAVNAAALTKFLRLLWSANYEQGTPALADKKLLGPVRLKHWKGDSVEPLPGLFVGKVRTDLLR